ncbi:hypothetical protein OJ998_06790 [Solirubrobacter taibaiensis]|nr:hypothetical protein [Solirubrobacter taibaiensis]
MTRPAAPGRSASVPPRPRRAAVRPRALLAAALLPAALFAAGCGGGEDPERAEVRAYLERVNEVQTARKDVLVRADTVLRGYAQGATIGAPALKGVEADVRRVRAAVAGVSPPPAARDVHNRLLKIYDVDAGLVAETQRMVEYEAAAPATLEPLDRASQTLRRDLRRARTARTQAKALDRFGDTLARVSRRLDGLDVPTLLEPAHESQLKRLAATRRLSRQLQSAVRAKDSRRVAKLLLRFRKSTQAPASSERALTKRGITAYTSRLKELTEAQKEFGRAQARLNRTFRETET